MGGGETGHSIPYWDANLTHGGKRDVEQLSGWPVASDSLIPSGHSGSILERNDLAVPHAKEVLDSPTPVESGSSAMKLVHMNKAAEFGGEAPPPEPVDARLEYDDSTTRPMHVNSSGYMVGERIGYLAQEDQAKTHLRSTRLYNLMQIKADKQDLSFVEKVMLPQNEIFDLCNRVVPNSARNFGPDNRLQLRFSELNRCSLRCVGYYGDKIVMMDIFRFIGLIDPGTLKIMQSKEKLQPGLYGVLHDDAIHIFYWHQGEDTLPAASRKDISCNFIRYLVELCDVVHICLNSSGLEPLLSASKSTFSKKKRTQRLKISVVKASENDLKFHMGFEVDLSSSLKTLTSADQGSASKMITDVSLGVPFGAQSFQLTEGFHRVALLVATIRHPTMNLKTDHKDVKVNEVPQLLQTWLANYNLDIHELDNNEFTLLLQCAKLEAFEGFFSLKAELNKKVQAQHSKEYDLDNLVSAEEGRVLEIFKRGVSSYIKLHFSWEEALLSDEFADKSSPSDTEVQQGDGHVTASPKERQSKGVDSSLINPLDSKCNINGVTTLEREIREMWTGSQGLIPSSMSDLMFVDSEISFRNIMNDSILVIPGSHSDKFTLHKVESSGARQFGPILFDEDYLLKSVGSSCKGKVVRFLSTEGTCRVGPVLTCQPLHLILKGNSKKISVEGGIKVHKRPPSDPMAMWMESFSGVTLSSLQRKASLVQSGLEQFKSMAAVKGVNLDQEDSLIKALLSDSLDEYSKVIKPSLISHFVDYMKSEWEILQKESSTEASEQTISPAVKAVCAELHDRGRHLFQQKVSSMVKSTIFPLLKEKAKTDLELQKKALEKQVNGEEAKYIQNVRDDFSTWKEGLTALTIQKCKHQDSYVEKLWSWSNERKGSLSISYSTELIEKENVTWKAIELVPMKRDLDALGSNPGQTVVPIVYAPIKLIDLDSREQRLLKVVYLRSGQVLVFVEKFVGEPLLTIYLCAKLGANLSCANSTVVLRKRVDMVAFDEQSRFVALYVSSISSIQIYFFDESFTHMEWTGMETNLKEYTGSHNLIWMKFVPGKAELVLIDSLNGVRLLELTQTPMFRPRHIHIPFPFTKACISADGSCLIVLHKIVTLDSPDEFPAMMEYTQSDGCHPTEPAVVRGENSDEKLEFEVYWLDTMVHLKSHVNSEITVTDMNNIEASVVTFGSQMHLLIYNTLNSALILSRVLESSSASEVCEMKIRNSAQEPVRAISSFQERSEKSCSELDFVYHIFDKYSSCPPLKIKSPDADSEKREIQIIILLMGLHETQSELGAKCKAYLNLGFQKLRTEKGKNFSQLAVRIQSHPLKTWLKSRDIISEVGSQTILSHSKLIPIGQWIQILVCLVPIQIARAENNGLKPLVDGLQIPCHLSYADALSLAGILRFGFYESLLECWIGEIKVISSMGKQSSGKSYLLNHSSGSLLDVAGGRCTDGVWMTMRPTKECLYVLLDFEGLGSFERSEQEDMLLSIFNAAVSNITIFNKKDFHLDKETEAVFKKFQNGVSLVKEDEKLFQGLFYIAIKDVDTSDVEDLKAEFQEKISQICSKSQQNFLTRMYGGEVEIAAMPPFQRSEYHDSIKEIAVTVEELGSCYKNGLSFSRDLKLVLSQISAKDWSSIDSKRVAFKICLLRRHWETAISSGCLVVEDGACPEFINFDTGEEIADVALIQVAGKPIQFRDTGVRLAPLEIQVMGAILEPIRAEFQNLVPRKGENDEAWHSLFQNFLSAIAERRKQRVLDWLHVNTAEFDKREDVQKLRLEALATLAELQQRLSLCSCKCKRCFLRCVQERSHPGDHSCKSTHRCTQICTYCSDETASASGGLVSECNDVAGHEGPHDCQGKAHACGLHCSYSGAASNCNKLCTLKARHVGDHKGNSRQHMCSSKCSLLGCNNPCVIPFELGDHDHHACHEKMCPQKCTMQGCNRNCSSKDHFHAQRPRNPFESNHHFCGSEHPCYEKCEALGICEVLTEVVKKTRTFQGKRATFEYEHVSEQNGMRKDCCIVIPPFEEVHQGPHLHTTSNNAVHFCETRCQACGYFCNLPIDHNGLHSTNHGNMTDVSFVSEAEEIDILDRKYTWGESGEAEMCMMHCKNQGRGHIHLIPCLSKTGGTCAAKHIEGARHETCRYGPDVDIPKDEVTHAAFWKHMRFKDPCSEEEQRLFSLCNNQCRSSEHNVSSANSSQQPSFCVETLWHTPVPKTGSRSSGAGYITDDGHHFSCDHSKDMENHVLFFIDRSSSMACRDCTPTMQKFMPRHNNRLGCVYESILRFILTRRARNIQDSVSVVLFNHLATKAVEGQIIAEALVDQLLTYYADGGTTYSCGLEATEMILSRSASNTSIQKKSPVVIFLSGGGNGGGTNPVSLVRRMKQVEPKLVFHTIAFGTDSNNQILKDMAAAGSGSFQVSLDEIQLARSFEGLARSLKHNVSSLM